MNVSPIRGPSTDETPKAIPKKEVNIGRLRRGTRGTEGNDDHYAAAKDASSARDEDGDEEHPFGRIELVDAAKKRTEYGGSQHVGAAIPADILDRVKVVGNAGDGGSYDHSILLGP